jgi:hypothetical protein
MSGKTIRFEDADVASKTIVLKKIKESVESRMATPSFTVPYVKYIAIVADIKIFVSQAVYSQSIGEVIKKPFAANNPTGKEFVVTFLSS